MTSQLVTVRPGAPQLVASNPAGSPVVFVNRDSNNGVWIGSDASVGPGQGLFLAALGSVAWNPAGTLGAVYACLDDGVTDPVVLNLSTEAQAITDPVALAAATATELFASGVPFVKRSELVALEQEINSATYYDVSSYQSATIRFKGGNTLPTALIINQYNSVTNIVDSIWTEIVYATVLLQSVTYTFEIVGDRISVAPATVTDQGTIIDLVASSVPARYRINSAGDTGAAQWWTLASESLSSGQGYQLTSSTYPQKLQGLCYMRAHVNLSTAKGWFRIVTPTWNVIMLDVAEMTVSSDGSRKVGGGLVSLPASPYRIEFLSTAAQTLSADVWLIPANEN